MRKSTITYTQLGSLWLEADLAADVQALLFDPRTGRTRYGELKRVANMLFANWVASQRDANLPPPKDL